jgi:hypothetical protein
MANVGEANSIVITEKPAAGISSDSRKPAGSAGQTSPEGVGGGGGGGGLCMWMSATDCPIPILDQATVSHNGNLYTFAGVSAGAVVDSAFCFDGSSWSSIAPTPQTLEFPSAVSDGTFIYLLSGVDGVNFIEQTTLYRYNPGTNTYTQLASCSTGTWNQTAVYSAGKIYKFCGSTATGSTNVLEIYDIGTNTWSLGAPYPAALSFVSSFASGGLIYGAGGIDGNSGVESAKTYCYNPGTNTWDDAAIADLPGTRWGAASTPGLFGPGGGSWVLAGGYQSGVIGPSAVSWNPGTNTWTTIASMIGERARMTGAVLNGNFYVVGGRDNVGGFFDGTVSNQELICLENMAFITAGDVSIVSEDCTPANGAPDPGETLTVSLPLMNGGDIPTVALTATLQATGGVTNPSAPVNYGAVAPDNLPVSGQFTFTVDSNLACGDGITLTWLISDGAENYPNAVASYDTGAAIVSLGENMDGVSVPSLPAGWASVQTVGTEINWVTATSSPFSAPNSAFANDPGNVNACGLVSPSVAITSSAAQLSFKNRYMTENSFDGCVLEFSTNGGGTWTDIIDGGGSFVSGGYSGVISSSFMSPISGRMAWEGDSGGYVDTLINLPASFNGQNVIFRWLMASDNSVTSTGIWIDDIQVLGGRECSDCQGVQTVFPDTITTTRGTYVSGDINSIATSDNSDYVIRRATSDTVSRTEFVVTGSSSTTSPSSFDVTLEGAVFARSTVVQSIFLFNYVTASYEMVDMRNASNMVDSTVMVSATGDLSRFVDQTTMEVRARVLFQSAAAPRQRFSSNTDMFIWMIGN